MTGAGLGPGEVLGKALRVDGGRGDDDLQVGPARQQLLEVAEQEINVEAALVRLVDDDRVVAAQQRIVLRLGQQDTVGHQLDRGAGRQRVVETHLVADVLAQRRADLLGDALGGGGGGDAPRLRMADQPGAARADAAPDRQADLGQLRGLARAGLAADDHHLVRGDGPGDLVAPGRDRQRFGKADRRHRVGARAAGFQRGGERFRRRLLPARATAAGVGLARLARGPAGVVRGGLGGCRRRRRDVGI